MDGSRLCALYAMCLPYLADRPGFRAKAARSARLGSISFFQLNRKANIPFLSQQRRNTRLTDFIPSSRLTSSLYSPLGACLGFVNGWARAWVDDEAAVEISDERGWKGTAFSLDAEVVVDVDRRERTRGMTRKRGSMG